VRGAGTILGMRLLIGVLPAVFILIGNLFLVLYPLNKKRYEEVVGAHS